MRQATAERAGRLAGLWASAGLAGSKLTRFARSHMTGAVSIAVLLVIGLLVVMADVISPFSRDRTVASRFQAPMSRTWQGERLWLGSDELGRDMVTRLLHGGRTSLYVGVMAPLLGVSIGTILGIVTAYFGGAVDLFVQRLVDTILALPGLILAMAIIVTFGFTTFVVVIAIASWMVGGSTRVVRSRALSLCQMQYVEAARAIGASHWRILFRHLVPNSIAVSIVLFAVNIGSAITSEAALSFLGLGIQPPTPSWGNMLAGAQTYFKIAPLVAVYPGVTITIVVLAMNLFGDSLRDILDPRLRGRR